jgi:hypothetical protein
MWSVFYWLTDSKVYVSWYVTQCSSRYSYQRFGEAYFSHLQGSLLQPSTWKQRNVCKNFPANMASQSLQWEPRPRAVVFLRVPHKSGKYAEQMSDYQLPKREGALRLVRCPCSAIARLCRPLHTSVLSCTSRIRSAKVEITIRLCGRSAIMAWWGEMSEDWPFK